MIRETVAKQIRLGVDIDGVLSNFNASFINLVNSMFGDKIHLADDWEPQVWSWSDAGVITKEQEDAVWKEIMKSNDFWLGMKPYTENVNAMDGFLSRIQYSNVPVSVFYITSRATTSGMAVLKQTRLWLEAFQLHRYNTAILPVVHSNNSGGLPPKRALVEILGLDAIVDDYGPTIQSINQKGYLLNRPWNQEYQHLPEIAVVNSLEEFLDKFEPERAVAAL